MSALRLGVDARKLLDDRRGIGRYTRALLRSWYQRSRDRVSLTLLVPDLLPFLVSGRLSNELGFELPAARRRSGFDLVWYPWNGMTWVSGDRKVATVHDCWPFANPAKDAAIRRNEQTPFRTTAMHADFIIADSAFGKSEIVRRLNVDESKIEIVNLGVDPVPAGIAQRGKAVAKPPQPYILFVGEAEKRKDLRTLLLAMGRLPTDLRERYELIVVGRGQPGEDDLVPQNATVTFKGEVSDARLEELYEAAALFVFPSRYEGFGLPVLEAMSYGVPVIASDAASVPEACGDAAQLFPVGDAPALAAAIEHVLRTPATAARLHGAGLARAKAMTWDACADKTLAILERVART